MDDKEIIHELLLQVRSLTERTQQLTDMMLGLSPTASPLNTSAENLQPIHRRSQFRQLISLADKANRSYWEQKAKEAEEEVIRANQEHQTIRSSGSDIGGENKGSDANGSGTGNDGQNASQETSEVRQGASKTQVEEMINNPLLDIPYVNE